jgi:lipoate-protein ligase A
LFHFTEKDMPESQWRLLDLKLTSYARATILASVLTRMRTEGRMPNTFALATFEKPSTCLFYYNDPDKELDLNFCRDNDIEVGRRDTGGSPYWADPGTLIFFLWFDRKDVPGFPQTIPEAYRFLIGTASEALTERYGIPAVYRPLNDLEVQGKKLSGHTMMFFGDVCRWGGGPQILIPRLDLMTKALRPPPEKFADKEAKSVQERVTNLETLWGRVPSFEEVKQTYISALEKAFEVKFEHGDLTPEERRLIDEQTTQGLSTDWIMAMSEERKFGDQTMVRFHRGEHLEKVPQGPMIRAVVLMNEGVIENISLTGSIHCMPVEVIEEMETSLKGTKAAEAGVAERVRSIFQRPQVQIANSSPDDFVRVIMRAVEKAGDNRSQG